MRSNSKFLVLNLCLVLGVAGCASPPPTGEVELAKATIEKAIAAGAASFAVESLKAARQAQAALDAELKTQEAKRFKSYDKAKDLAVAVQAAGDKAAADAAAGKEKTMAEATSATSEDRNGPNLFRNGNFAEGLQGWNRHPESDSDVSIDLSRPNERAWHTKYRKGNWGVIYQELALQPDTVYVYEATVKTTAQLVALYWQSEIGRFLESDKPYPEWTHLRYVFLTPHWTGQPYRTGFNPVLMKGPGDAWLKDLRLFEFKAKG